MTVPDVSVIIAVFNTMPHLRDTLASLERQTIGIDRMQIVLIDDGSTDASSAEIDTFAARFPGQVAAHRQANSGGPASPFNRGLERATGRYVFFLGADDHLADFALERLVRAADEWDSDIVAGKTIGVGGRSVNQRLFNLGTTRELDLFDSPLPYNLANSKLFRRELIERLSLRFREDIRSHCDHPFTFTALMHAKRVSVLADEPYYFAVKQESAGNVTFTTSPQQVLGSQEVILGTMAAHLEPGVRRDYYVRRQFEWELVALLNPAFLTLPTDEQHEVFTGVGDLARRYLSDEALVRIRVRERLRLALARAGSFDRCVSVIESTRNFKQGGTLPFARRDGRLYARFPGYGEDDTVVSWYEIGDERLTGRVDRAVSTTSARWNAEGLDILLCVAITGLEPDLLSAGLASFRTAAQPAGPARGARGAPQRLAAVAGLTLESTEDCSEVRLQLPAARVPVGEGRWSLRLRLTLGPRIYDVPVSLSAPERSQDGQFGGPRRLAISGDDEGRLIITAAPRRRLWRKR